MPGTARTSTTRTGAEPVTGPTPRSRTSSRVTSAPSVVATTARTVLVAGPAARAGTAAARSAKSPATANPTNDPHAGDTVMPVGPVPGRLSGEARCPTSTSIPAPL